jgi:molybdate transport system regulatory protein
MHQADGHIDSLMQICHNGGPEKTTEAFMGSFDEFLARHIEVRSKVWLEDDGAPLMGAGRAQLLRTVDRFGSINAAAKELGMDYRKAWGLIDSMEKRLHFKLVIRRRGGSSRGTALTEECRRLLGLYEDFERRSQSTTDEQFVQIFKNDHKGDGHET